MNPYQRIITLDFETYYSPTYSLRSATLNTSSYIRHPEFKAHCVGIKIDDAPTTWVPNVDIADALQSLDWKSSAMLAHHASFDGLILNHHYGIHPVYYLDTLSMARALHSNAIGAGLDELAGFYKLGHKTPDVLRKLYGVRDPDSALLSTLGEYCARDVDLCWGIYQRMILDFPRAELDLIDITVRMFADPILRLDMPRLKAELLREQQAKEQTIAASGVSLAVLSSTEKFAHELVCSGVPTPPQKQSPSNPKKTIWAFSKTDIDFLNLRGHESERVRNLVAARLAAKSTIGESRAKRLIDAGRGGLRLPVYLKYFGAHTGRWAGGDKLNMQNLPRPVFNDTGEYVYPSAELRRSIYAPEDHVLVVVDSAQIEARVLAWLASDEELLRLFRAKQDVYKAMAATIYLTSSARVTKEQRFVGKVATLGLGYGMGPEKFKLTLALGPMGSKPVFVNSDQAWHIVDVYRSSRSAVTRLWRHMESILYSMTRNREGDYKGLIWSADKRIRLPNGMYLQYPYLEYEHEHYQYFDYKTIIRKKMSKTLEDEKGKMLHGGSFTENVVQALARVIIGEQMVAIANYLTEVGDGFFRRIVTMSHDEIVVCVPKDEAETVLGYMLYVMRTSPSWAPDLPLDAEGTFAENYAK